MSPYLYMVSPYGLPDGSFRVARLLWRFKATRACAPRENQEEAAYLL